MSEIQKPPFNFEQAPGIKRAECKYEELPHFEGIIFYDGEHYSPEDVHADAVTYELIGKDRHGQCEVDSPILAVINPGEVLSIGISSKTGNEQQIRFKGEKLDERFEERLSLYVYAAYLSLNSSDYDQLAGWRQTLVNQAVNNFGWNHGIELIEG